MANPYTGVSTTEPEALPAPSESLRTPVASPASFGGALAQAGQEVGRNLSVAGAHWGEIAADDASNQFQSAADKLLQGDPQKMVTDPDGTQHPDVGYLGLKGAEALRQRGSYDTQLNQLLKDTRAGLYSADQRLRFDNFSRRYRAVIASKMGTHADQQAGTFAVGVAKGQIGLGVDGITTDPSEENFLHRQEDIIDGFVKIAQQNGAQPGDVQYQAAIQEGKRAAANARIRSIGVKDPAAAAAMTEKYKGVLGKDYATLGDHYRTRADEEGGASVGADAYGAVSSEPPAPGSAPATGHLNEETQSVLGNIQGSLKSQGIDVEPSSTYRSPARNAQVGGKQASRHTTGQAFDLPTAGKSQDQLEKMFDAIAAQKGVSQIGWEGDHFHVGTGEHAKGKIAFGPNKNDLAGAPDWFVQKVKAWQGTAAPVTGSPTAGAKVTDAQPVAGTHLEPADEAAYQKWAQDKSAGRGFNVDSADYDMRGYWKEHGQGATPQGDEHYPDTYKLPNHPTFSVESKYSTLENPGGRWVGTDDGKGIFIAGRANVANGIEKTRQYLANNDPNVQLVVPQGLQGNEAPAPAKTGSMVQPVVDNPAVQAAQRRASAIERIVRSDMNPRAKSAAIRTINELATADQLKWAAQDKANKDAAIAGMDEYVKMLAPGQIVPPNIVAAITSDPRFNHAPEMREKMIELAKHHSGSDVQEATQAYGPGFWKLYQRVTAQPNDPERLADPTELLRHAGPGGDITLAGVNQLKATMAASQKSVDTHSVETSKASLMSYAKSKLSFEQDVGPIKIRDPKGEQIFTAQFVPKFLSAYDKWLQAGKNPWEFLTQENVDKTLKGMRDPAEMARAKLEAQGDFVAPNPATLPPAPARANPDGWKTLMANPPKYSDGRIVRGWDKAIEKLRADPTPATIANFNATFGPAGYRAEEIVESLNRPSGPQPPPANVELQRAQAARRQAPASPTANAPDVVTQDRTTLVVTPEAQKAGKIEFERAQRERRQAPADPTANVAP